MVRPLLSIMLRSSKMRSKVSFSGTSIVLDILRVLNVIEPEPCILKHVLDQTIVPGVVLHRQHLYAFSFFLGCCIGRGHRIKDIEIVYMIKISIRRKYCWFKGRVRSSSLSRVVRDA